MSALRNERQGLPGKAGQQLISAERADGFGRQQGPFQPAGIREHLFDGNAPQESLQEGAPKTMFDVVASLFEQTAVLDPTWADGFAGAAPQAQINVPHRGRLERQPALLQGPHKVDATSWGVVLVTCLEIGGASTEAEPAMDARSRLSVIEEQAVPSPCSRRVLVDVQCVHVGRSAKMCFGSNSSLRRRSRTGSAGALAGELRVRAAFTCASPPKAPALPVR